MDDDQGKKKATDSNECVSVVVRCRPMNRKETDEKRTSIIDIDVAGRQVSIKNPADPDDAPKSFTYDGAYDEATQQRVFYEESCFGIIESVLEGFNGTIFAYGQTGLFLLHFKFVSIYLTVFVIIESFPLLYLSFLLLIFLPLIPFLPTKPLN